MSYEGLRKLGELIRKTRGTMSREAFGKLFGVSHTAIARWEKGEVVPEFENLAHIAARCGYSLEEINILIEGKPMPKAGMVDRMINELSRMAKDEVALVVKAGVERLTASGM